MHPADQFDAFRLMVDAGRSVEEVAARMGRSVNAVRKLWTRAMLELRRELGSDEL